MYYVNAVIQGLDEFINKSKERFDNSNNNENKEKEEKEENNNHKIIKIKRERKRIQWIHQTTNQGICAWSDVHMAM